MNIHQNEFIYDVAFSFLFQDEKLVHELNDLINSQVKTFIYSKQQEELVGTDGIESFNRVFHNEARIVVVLYRERWGQTPWTKVEEIAIKNRAIKGDWNFFIIIRLDKSPLPNWIPQINIWFDLDQFGIEKAAGAILFKVSQWGGKIHKETLEDKAYKMLSKRKAQQERILFLQSPAAIVAANKEMEQMVKKLSDYKSVIEGNGSIHLGTKAEQSHPLMLQFNYQNYALCINNRSPFERDYSNDSAGRLDGYVRIILYTFSGHQPFNYKEEPKEYIDYKFDQDMLGKFGWSELENPSNFYSTDELIDVWVEKFIKGIGEFNIRD